MMGTGCRLEEGSNGRQIDLRRSVRSQPDASPPRMYPLNVRSPLAQERRPMKVPRRVPSGSG